MPTRSCSPSAGRPTSKASGWRRRASSSTRRARSRSTNIRKTSVDHIWAIGDVTDRLQLTPGRHPRGDVLRGYRVPRPPDQARPQERRDRGLLAAGDRHGRHDRRRRARERIANLDIYKTAFRPLKGTLTGRSDRMLMKLVVDADTDRVLGAHVLGPGAGEMAQLLGIPVKFGATKADFDATMAVHPTAGEELVTFGPPTERIRKRRDARRLKRPSASTLAPRLAALERFGEKVVDDVAERLPLALSLPRRRAQRRRAGGRRWCPPRRCAAPARPPRGSQAARASSADQRDHLLDQIGERHGLAAAEIEQLAARAVTLREPAVLRDQGVHVLPPALIAPLQARSASRRSTGRARRW